MDTREVDAAILAGGFGTRLRTVVSDRPKVLAPVAERPFLCYLLDQLTGAGIEHVVLCTGYLGEQVEQQFGHKFGDLYLDYSKEEQPLGTGGALEYALPLIETPTVLVTNGDSFCGFDFDQMKKFHDTKGARITMALIEVEDVSRYGSVVLADDGTVDAFEEKKAAEGCGLVNAGIYLIERNLLKQIPQGKQVSLEKEVFPGWIGKGFYGWVGSGPFLDIGTEESFAKAQEFFAGWVS